MERNFYVYLFKATIDKVIKIDGIDVTFKNGDVYYIGEGNGNRIKHMTRNNDCNTLTEMLKGEIVIYEENLTKQEALDLEKDLIEEYKNIGYIANKTDGQKTVLQREKIPIIKYLIELDRQGIIEMSYYDLERETDTSRSSFYGLQDNVEYITAIPHPPENIEYILKRYEPIKVQNNKLLGELKYFIDLIDKKYLKMSYKDLYCDVYNTYHDKIKEAKAFPYSIRPPEDILNSVISKYGYHIKSDKEILYGKILSCLNLKERYNLKVTDLQIAELYNVNLTKVTDIKRRFQNNIVPMEIEPEIIGILFNYDRRYLVPDESTPKNEKFEWIKKVN